MDLIVTGLFALTYLGMAAGRLPGLRLDRAGIALAVAVTMVASGALSPAAAGSAVHFPTLLLMAGLMIVSGRFRAAGIYDGAAAWLAARAERPALLLALTVAAGGILSALLINDIVVFAMTPILCISLTERGRDPRPYLLALAAASNAGSAATLIGNPQNILIGQAGGLDFWRYAAVAAPPALAALAAVFLCVAWIWRRSLWGSGAIRGPGAGVTHTETRGAVAAGTGAAKAGAAGALRGAGRSGAGGALVPVAGLGAMLVLFATPMSREMVALVAAAALIVSRRTPSRVILGEIDVPLLILFAGLFVINAAFAATGLPAAAVQALAAAGLTPGRGGVLVPFTLVSSNTIGNVPAVILLLAAWPGLSTGTLTALAILSTLAGNLLLVGSLANLITAERAAGAGVRLTFRDHARSGVPITLVSMIAAGLWLWALGLLPA